MFPAGFPEVEEDRVIIFPASLPSTSFSSVGQQDGSSSVGEAPNRIVMSVFDWNFQPKGKQRPPPTSMGSADKYRVLSREILPLGQITFFAGVKKCDPSEGHTFLGDLPVASLALRVHPSREVMSFFVAANCYLRQSWQSELSPAIE